MHFKNENMSTPKHSKNVPFDCQYKTNQTSISFVLIKLENNNNNKKIEEWLVQH